MREDIGIYHMLPDLKFKILLVSFLIISFPNVSGAQIILRDWRGNIKLERSADLFKNMPLYKYDKIETFEGARIKIFVDDKLRINLGENSKLVIENYTDKQAIIKFYRGLIRVEELKPFRYQVKTPNSFVSKGRQLSRYFISASLGRANFICVSGLISIYESILKFNNTIPNGLINAKRGGMELNALWETSIGVDSDNNVMKPNKPQQLEKKQIAFYYEATQVIPSKYEFSKETIYDIIAEDSPIPETNLKEIEESIVKEKKFEKTFKAPSVFNPEAKEGFAFDEI